MSLVLNVPDFWIYQDSEYVRVLNMPGFGMVYSLQLGIRDSGFRIQFRYSVFTAFPDLKDFQDIQKHKSIKIKRKRKIVPEPIVFSTNKALNYHQMLGKRTKIQ